MDTFTKPQQDKHRKAFIDECRQKAWGAACHVDYIAKGLDDLMAQYQKVQDEDKALEANIKEADASIDYHTVDNRQKRKAMQEKRNELAKQMQLIAANAQEGYKSMAQLQQSVESALQLAAHAEPWEWKEAEPALVIDFHL